MDDHQGILPRFTPHVPGRRAWIKRGVALAACGLFSGTVRAQEHALAVLYPEIGEPFRTVFRQMVGGVEEGARAAVRSHAVGSDTDLILLGQSLRRGGTRAVIAPGSTGPAGGGGHGSGAAGSRGGVLATPDMLGELEHRNVVGVSLMPDPALMFGRLKGLLPGVRRVSVVFNPERSEWLMRLARDAARLHGIDLIAYEARDLASAARLYEGAFSGTEGRRDAIWLPQDPSTVDENAIMPLVLRESWNRGVALFSSSFPHVRKGALFALYPNNVEHGRTLASLAEQAWPSDARRRAMLPLRDVQIAVNLRTASHLGLNFGSQQQRSFDITFPEQ